MLQSANTPAVNRPNPVAVGTIVWLGSEVMFFAGLFAIYFTLKTSQPGLWTQSVKHLNVPYAAVNTLMLVSSSFTCQFGVFAAERLQARSTGWKPSSGAWSSGSSSPTRWARSSSPARSGSTRPSSARASRSTPPPTGRRSSSPPASTALHVTGGLFAFLPDLGRAFAVKQFTHKEATTAIVVSYYWHFVDVVWIGLFLVIYVLR